MLLIRIWQLCQSFASGERLKLQCSAHQVVPDGTGRPHCVEMSPLMRLFNANGKADYLESFHVFCWSWWSKPPRGTGDGRSFVFTFYTYGIYMHTNPARHRHKCFCCSVWRSHWLYYQSLLLIMKLNLQPSQTLCLLAVLCIIIYHKPEANTLMIHSALILVL